MESRAHRFESVSCKRGRPAAAMRFRNNLDITLGYKPWYCKQVVSAHNTLYSEAPRYKSLLCVLTYPAAHPQRQAVSIGAMLGLGQSTL